MGDTIVQGPRAAYALVMGSRGAGTLLCRAGGGWVSKGQARPLVDGVWGRAEVSLMALIRFDAGEAPQARGMQWESAASPLPRLCW